MSPAATDPAGRRSRAAVRETRSVFSSPPAIRRDSTPSVLLFFVYLVAATWDDSSEGKTDAAYVPTWGGDAGSGLVLARFVPGDTFPCRCQVAQRTLKWGFRRAVCGCAVLVGCRFLALSPTRLCSASGSDPTRPTSSFSGLWVQCSVIALSDLLPGVCRIPSLLTFSLLNNLFHSFLLSQHSADFSFSRTQLNRIQHV